MACLPCYKDYISCGVETIEVIGKLTPTTAYEWVLENKGAKYSGDVTTDANGLFVIPISDLPNGLLNPYAGSFTLTVLADDAYLCATQIWNDSAYCTPYDCVIFEVINGSIFKNTLGCPCLLM